MNHRYLHLLLSFSVSAPIVIDPSVASAFPVEAVATEGKCYVCHARKSWDQPLIGQGGWLDGRTADGLIEWDIDGEVLEYVSTLDESGDTISVTSAPFIPANDGDTIVLRAQAAVPFSIHSFQVKALREASPSRGINDPFQFSIGDDGLAWREYTTSLGRMYQTTAAIRGETNGTLEIPVTVTNTLPDDLYLLRLAVAGRDDLGLFYDALYVYLGSAPDPLDNILSVSRILGQGYVETASLGLVYADMWPWLYKADTGWFRIESSISQRGQFWAYLAAPAAIESRLIQVAQSAWFVSTDGSLAMWMPQSETQGSPGWRYVITQ